VEQALQVLGSHLVGVVAFGSWARDELATDSDVDHLVVVKADVEIERPIYAQWDQTPLDWSGRSVEPHFAHLPGFGARISGLWAEVAVDGIVLFDRDLALSRRLVEIRRRIASGEMVRRTSHGHSYWVDLA
jgi:predicted nucleotidyltransferase